MGRNKLCVRRLESELRMRSLVRRPGLPKSDRRRARLAARLDDRAEQVVRRPPRVERSLRWGRDARNRARGRRGRDDRPLHVGGRVAALIASLVGGLRPQWLVGVLLGSGWMLVVGTYLVLFWSSAGQTPGMRLLRVRVHGPAGEPLSVDHSCAWSGSCSRSCRCSPASFLCCSPSSDAGSDFLAGTVVVYDDVRASELE